MGTRFCGARGSLYEVEANRGSVTTDRSASATASTSGSSAEHSMRTTPAQGAPEVVGSRRYQAYRCQVVPTWKTGVRSCAFNAVTTAVSAAGRYSTRWVLT